MITFTKPELETLAMALDALARDQQDVLEAARKLIPIRDKINEGITEAEERDKIVEAVERDEPSHE